MLHQILLVEDSIEMQIAVNAALGPNYAVTSVDEAAAALELIKERRFEVAVIDIMLSSGNGFELLAQARQIPNGQSLPVIFLSSKSATSDKVLAFAVGADDYVVKPFDPLELKARVESKLKKIQDLKVIRGQFRLNLGTQQVFIDDDGKEFEAGLTPSEFKLLALFMRNEGQVLSRESILDAIWGKSLNVTDRTIDTHIYSLRKKVGSASRCISSVFGQGYVFKTAP